MQIHQIQYYIRYFLGKDIEETAKYEVNLTPLVPRVGDVIEWLVKPEGKEHGEWTRFEVNKVIHSYHVTPKDNNGVYEYFVYVHCTPVKVPVKVY